MADRDLLVDIGSPAQWRAAGALVWRALVRHRLSVAALVVLFGAAGAGAAAITPRMYSTETRLLVRTNPLMAALAHPRRAVPVMENLTQSASELVHNRQAILGIIEQYDLLARWERDRPPVLRLKDAVMATVRGPLDDDARREALVEVVARRISVNVEEQTVRVRASWTDRQTTMDLAQGALDAFFDGRRRVDVEAIEETHAVLAQSAEVLRLDLEARVAAVERVAQVAPRPVAVASLVVDRVAPVALIDPLAEARTRVLAARQREAALVDQYTEQRRALDARLADLLTRATDRHPDVLALRRQIAGAAEEPADLRSARAESAVAWQAFTARGGREADLAGPVPMVPSAAPRVDPGVNLTRIVEEDGATLYSRSLLKSSIAAYQDLLERLGNTRLELETARAAFDFKYSVTAPARRPKQADSPNVLAMVLAALMAGAGLGVTRATYLTWKAGA
jgi:uncharacterized protein involved in exopolysaccharide biosynthesis